MLDVINQDYVLTAESKGLSRGQIIRRHILRNSFIPVITQLPMSVAMCITGSFFIESIFSIPGIGQYYVTAVNNQDLSIIMGETVLSQHFTSVFSLSRTCCTWSLTRESV